MISLNLINNLKESKRRNKNIIKVYKERSKNKDLNLKNQLYFYNMSLLL